MADAFYHANKQIIDYGIYSIKARNIPKDGNLTVHVIIDGVMDSLRVDNGDFFITYSVGIGKGGIQAPFAKRSGYFSKVKYITEKIPIEEYDENAVLGYIKEYE